MENDKKHSWITITILVIEIITITALIVSIGLIIAFPSVTVYVISVIEHFFDDYYSLLLQFDYENQYYIYIQPYIEKLQLSNHYYSFILAFVVIFILFFIRKQIKFSKNRDTLLGLQNNISNYFTENYKEHSQCYDEIERTLKKCLLIRNKTEINLIVQMNETSNLGRILENIIKKYAFNPIKNNLMNTAFYELWLGKDYKSFENIISGENYQIVNRFYDIYGEVIEQLSKIEILYSTEQTYKQIHDTVFEQIKAKLVIYNASYDSLVEEFNVFFKKLAKHKKI